MGKLHVFFLQPILVEIEDAKEADFQGLASDKPLCKELTKCLRLDPFFLTAEAWKSNGFLISQQHQEEPTDETKDELTRNYATRFLIKFLDEPANTQGYSWLYLSFSILWVKKKDQISCVLVCFDDSINIEPKISECFTNYSMDNIMQNPLAIHDALLRAIVFHYDEALWLFRTPVRGIEKDRRKFVESISGSEDGQPGDSKKAVDDLIKMHEYSRHAIHMSETLRVAQKTVKAMLQVAESHGSNGSIPDGMIDNTLAGLQFSNLFLANLKLRSDAFVDRIKNEIRLAYNIISVTQLQESRQEGKDLTSIVTMLSLVFLPATFVAGFWGMNFIALEGRNIIISDQIWWFAVSAVTAVVLCVSIWMGPHYFRMKYSLKGVISFLRGHLQPPVRAILSYAGKIKDKRQKATGTEPAPSSAV
ncbi:hypothetical protein F5X68DRAFT_264771 [Plectosphaerella plurivora]|uniref:Uncharacterized protein n=1 Tax=Plectosphaerella plurivora TaxID=936078 RepID=A0A9P8V3T9_9PEZI|nr:hypothetical protein F5X68DRAFT_264771 [Plectosphaerella plurivora]